MSLLRLENFDLMTGFGDSPNWSTDGTGQSLSTTQKRSGYQSAFCDRENSDIILSFGSNLATGILGFAIYPNERPWLTAISATYASWALQDGTNSHLQFCMTSQGGINVYRSTTLIASSESQKLIRAFQWNYVEIKWEISNTTGAASNVIRVNGEVVLTLPTSTDTQNAGNAYVGQARLAAFYNDAGVYYDDLYVCDLTGSVNNDFLGPIVVESLSPSGNGSDADFTGSDADQTDNYLLVDENPHDSDTSYVESDTATDRDSYALDNLSGTPDTIHAVVVKAVVKKDDTGTRTGKVYVKSGSTNYDGTEFTPGTTYSIEENLLEEDPDTSTEWTASGVNALEAGILVAT